MSEKFPYTMSIHEVALSILPYVIVRDDGVIVFAADTPAWINGVMNEYIRYFTRPFIRNTLVETLNKLAAMNPDIFAAMKGLERAFGEAGMKAIREEWERLEE